VARPVYMARKAFSVEESHLKNSATCEKKLYACWFDNLEACCRRVSVKLSSMREVNSHCDCDMLSYALATAV